MQCDDDTAEILRAAGYRVTPQRLAIAAALRQAGGHLTAAELLDHVRGDQPVIDISTVYRTLDTLKRGKLATATDMAGSDVVYEWASGDPHHHLVCERCESVADLDHAYLAALEAALRKDFGFEADLHHFAIFGRCAACGPDRSR